MKWNDKDSKIEFECSGRMFYANGYIGIQEYSGKTDIAQGYDQGITIENHNGEMVDDGNDQEFTLEERKELADYMIELWTKFKDQKD